MSHRYHTHVLARSTKCVGKKPHYVLPGSLSASNTWHKNTDRNTHTNAHRRIKKQHTCVHTIMLPKQIRSDASACECQEHAESALERVRGGLGERQYVCTGCDMPASACQDHTVPVPSANPHVQEKWDTSSRKSKWGGYCSKIYVFILCVFEKTSLSLRLWS